MRKPKTIKDIEYLELEISKIDDEIFELEEYKTKELKELLDRKEKLEWMLYQITNK